MLSLLSTPIAACTCAHHEHQEGVAAAGSFHEHEPTPSVARNGYPQIGENEDCSCIIREPSAATGKVADGSGGQQSLVLPSILSVPAEPLIASLLSAKAVSEAHQPYSNPTLLGLLPSRAPPTP